MERQIEQAAREADVALLLIDGSQPRDRAKLVRRFLEQARTPVIAALNKIDLFGLGHTRESAATNTERIPTCRVYPISALQTLTSPPVGTLTYLPTGLALSR